MNLRTRTAHREPRVRALLAEYPARVPGEWAPDAELAGGRWALVAEHATEGHVISVGDDRDEVIARSVAAIPDGWHAHTLVDLDSGDRWELDTTEPRVEIGNVIALGDPRAERRRRAAELLADRDCNDNSWDGSATLDELAAGRYAVVFGSHDANWVLGAADAQGIAGCYYEARFGGGDDAEWVDHVVDLDSGNLVLVDERWTLTVTVDGESATIVDGSAHEADERTRVELDGHTAELMRSDIDGVMLVQVDAPDDEALGQPACRVYVNDGAVYDGAREPAGPSFPMSAEQIRALGEWTHVGEDAAIVQVTSVQAGDVLAVQGDSSTVVTRAGELAGDEAVSS